MARYERYTKSEFDKFCLENNIHYHLRIGLWEFIKDKEVYLNLWQEAHDPAELQVAVRLRSA